MPTRRKLSAYIESCATCPHVQVSVQDIHGLRNGPATRVRGFCARGMFTRRVKSANLFNLIAPPQKVLAAVRKMLMRIPEWCPLPEEKKHD